MEITRYIRKDRMDKDGFCQLLIRVAWHQRRIRFNTGQFVKPDDTIELNETIIDPTTGKKKERKKMQTRNQKTNRVLDIYSDHLFDFFERFNGIPTEQEVRTEIERIRIEELNQAPKPAPAPEPEPEPEPEPVAQHVPRLPTFYEFWEKKFMEDHRGLKSDGYLRTFNPVLDHLKIFAPAADFMDITLPFALKFVQYMQSTGVTDEYAFTRLKKLRRVLKYARKCGIQVPDDYDDFPSYTPLTQREALKLNEIAQLQQAELSESLSRQRDVFLFQCYTGLRWGDLKHARPGNLHEIMGEDEEITKVLRLVQEKGRKSNLLPLSNYAIEILNKYGGTLPLISQQKYNEAIKDFAERAGLTRKFIKVVFRQGQRFDEEYALWEKLSSHSGRHTFAMLMLELKVDITEVADLMGHGSIATTMIYRTIRGEDKIRVVKDAWKNLPKFASKRATKNEPDK